MVIVSDRAVVVLLGLFENLKLSWKFNNNNNNNNSTTTTTHATDKPLFP